MILIDPLCRNPLTLSNWQPSVVQTRQIKKTQKIPKGIVKQMSEPFLLPPLGEFFFSLVNLVCGS
jgi:hypothetical protein